jgi:hypothetical protein
MTNQRWALFFIILLSSPGHAGSFYIIEPIIATMPKVLTILKTLAIKLLIPMAIGWVASVVLDKILDAIHDKKNEDLVAGLFPLKMVVEGEQELLCKSPLLILIHVCYFAL